MSIAVRNYNVVDTRNTIKHIYLGLDTMNADERSLDGTKCTWYLENLLHRKKLKNIINIKIYTFNFRYSIGSPDRNRITISFDEIKESFKHRDRDFQFIGEIHNWKTDYYYGHGTKYVWFKFPYNDGTFHLNSPIRVLDKLTMSVADPFVPINLNKYYQITATAIVQLNPTTVRITLDGFSVLEQFTNYSVFISGAESDDPADAAYIAIINAYSYKISSMPTDYVDIVIGGVYSGNITGTIFNVLIGGLFVNLEITTLNINDKYKSSYSDNLNDNVIQHVNSKLSVGDNIFNKYNPKRLYLNLNSNLAFAYSNNVITWNLNYFPVQIPGYGSTNMPIKNIVAVKMLPVLAGFVDNRVSVGRDDVYLVYIREFLEQCFVNLANNIKYNFVLERRYVGPIDPYGGTLPATDNPDRYELTPYRCNEGWFRFNKPVSQLSSITLEGFRRLISKNDDLTIRSTNILVQNYPIQSLSYNGGLGKVVALVDINRVILVGTRLVISGFTSNTLDSVVVAQINDPNGILILAIPFAGLYVLDITIDIGANSYLSNDDGPVAVFPFDNTIFNFEFVTV